MALNTNINIHDFIEINFIFKFDDIVKFNSIKFIHRGFYNKVPINLQIRLIKNKNDSNKCIRKASITSRNLFRLTNIGVKYWNNLLIIYPYSITYIYICIYFIFMFIFYVNFIK